MEKCSVCQGTHLKGACPILTTVTGLKVEQLLADASIYLTSAPIPESEAMAILEEAESGKRFALPIPEFKVGRSSECDLVLSGDNNVSRVHFVIKYEVGKFFITDSESRNGTYLNGELLKEKKPLTDHARIRVGRYCFQFLLGKAYWSGSLPTSRMRQPRTFTAPALALQTTMDKMMTSAQRTALEMALQAVDNSRRSVSQAPQPVQSNELKALETQLAELNRQSREINERIRQCQSRIDAITAGKLEPQ